MTGKISAKIGARQILLGLAIFFCHALFLRNPTVATKAVMDGLTLCAKAVVPSLFPFLVLSSMLVEGDFYEPFFAPFARKTLAKKRILC